MSVEGIWTSEVYSAFGWDSHGILVLQDGNVIGGDHRQYTMGTYTESDGKFAADLRVHYYGPPRTVYGETTEQFAAKLSGALRDHVIEGRIGRPDRPEYDLQMRLTKRMDLPKRHALK